MKNQSGLTLLEVTIALAIILVVISGMLIGNRSSSEYSSLRSAAILLQADMRYAQRRAITEGRRVGIAFDPAYNRYTIITERPFSTIRTVYLSDGIHLHETSHARLIFLPRGTASSAFRLTLRSGTYWQRITATLSGGQVRIHDIIKEEHDGT